MAAKLSALLAVAAFLLAWVSGLAAGVPPDAILARSLIGSAVFYLLGWGLLRVATAFLGLPEEIPESGQEPAQPARGKDEKG